MKTDNVEFYGKQSYLLIIIEYPTCLLLSRVMRKHVFVFVVSNQVQHIPGCTVTKDS